MKKRVAEKVLSRAILSLAVYPKHTMASALRRRPKFWTERVPGDPGANDSLQRQMRLKFGETTEESSFSVEYAPGALETPLKQTTT